MANLWADYSLAFTSKDNDDAWRLAEQVQKEGIDPRHFDGGGVLFDQENPPDGKITATELYRGANELLNDGIKGHRQKMLRALKGAGLPVTGLFWNHKADVAQSMADRHNTEATRLMRAEKKDWAGIEKHLIAVTHYQPDDAGSFLNLGGFLLMRQEYAKALAAFQDAKTAVAADRYKNRAREGEIPLSVGLASYGAGDFKGARAAYTEHLENDPRDAGVLRLRLEADGKYLETLTDPNERGVVEGEMVRDRALSLALTADEEKARLDQIEKALSSQHGLSADEKKDKMAAVAALAADYLHQGGTSFEIGSDEEIVRSRLNGLSSQAFGILARFADADGDPDVRKSTDLYRGYALMAEGKVDEAVTIFKSIRTGFPEIDAMLRKMDDDALRAANLAGVDVWKVYVEEGGRIGHGKADERLSMVMEFCTGDWDGTKTHGRIDDVVRLENRLIAQVESRLNAESALTIKQALGQIAEDDKMPEDLRSRAASILKKGMHGGANGEGDTLGPMVDYLEKLPPDAYLADRLLHEAFVMESREGAAETPFAAYQLVAAISPEEDIKKRATDEMNALQKGGGFGRSFLKAVYATGTTGLLVDAAIMFASAGLGNLAKLRMLGYLEKAGVTGYRAVAVGRLTKYAVTATAMFVGNTGKAAMTQDAEKVFSPDHLVKSYASTLIMVGLSEPVSEFASAYGTRAAKALGLIAKGGEELSFGGKLFVRTLNHAAGLSGMMAASYVSPRAMNGLSRLVGWKEEAIRPFSETSAHDVYNYVLFSAAGRVTEGIFGKGYVDYTGKVHSEIALREARLKSKPLAERWVKATFGEKISEMTAGRKKALVDRRVDYLVSASFRPGFSGSVLVKHLEKGRFEQADRYLDGFGLSPLFSSHETLGISPPKAETAEPAAIAGAPRSSVPEWARAELAKAGHLFINGKWTTVDSIQGDTVHYTERTMVNGLSRAVPRTVAITDALIAENFGELSIGQIRPTENGLSPVRLKSAKDYLDEPVSVKAVTLPDGSVAYYALDGHHRLAASLAAGRTSVRVTFVEYSSDAIAQKIERPSNPNYPVPETVAGLRVNPLRADDHQGGLLADEDFIDADRPVRGEQAKAADTKVYRKAARRAVKADDQVLGEADTQPGTLPEGGPEKGPKGPKALQGPVGDEAPLPNDVTYVAGDYGNINAGAKAFRAWEFADAATRGREDVSFYDGGRIVVNGDAKARDALVNDLYLQAVMEDLKIEEVAGEPYRYRLTDARGSSFELQVDVDTL
ncbi:MAG TPA: hypothetical protein VFX30_08590 [bacterium]|nr:hypothetical protein [bacterium]